MPEREAPLPSHPADRERVEKLQAGGWSLLSAEEHPLGRLQGEKLGPFRLLALLGPKNSVGARYFQLYLVDGNGRLSREAVAFGLCNQGRHPGYNWFDVVRYKPTADMGGETTDLRERDEEQRLFRLLGELVPAGGHLMVEYDSPEQAETARILGRGLPAACSPLGYALLQAGCLSFRDWYIPEGGREGPRKLQGFKPLDEESARGKARERAQELEEALGRLKGGEEWQRTAERLARDALRLLATKRG